MSENCYAPWTPEQVDCLNKYQEYALDGNAHPFTCECGESLTAYKDGWECDYCHQWHQNWCHEFMLTFSTPTKDGNG